VASLEPGETPSNQDVAVSFEPGETPKKSASHQAQKVTATLLNIAKYGENNEKPEPDRTRIVTENVINLVMCSPVQTWP